MINHTVIWVIGSIEKYKTRMQEQPTQESRELYLLLGIKITWLNHEKISDLSMLDEVYCYPLNDMCQIVSEIGCRGEKPYRQ